MKNLSQYGILPEKNRPYENITYVMALIYNHINAQAEKYFAPYGLTVAKFNILMLAIYQNEGRGLNQTELANRLIASASNITKIVEQLVKRKLLTRLQNPHNRRENIIKPTPAGRKLAEEAWPGYNTLVKKLTDKIPAAQRKTAKEVLHTWLTNLQKENN